MLYLRMTDTGDPRLAAVKQTLKKYPGTNRVILYFSNQDKKLDGGSAVRVSDSPQLLEELGLILEEENVVMR